MHFVANRNVTVRSTLGHTLTFVKGQPTYVPERLRKEVLERNILPCDADGKPLPEEGEQIAIQEEVRAAPKLPPEDGDKVRKDIDAAIRAIVKRNVSADFTGGGMPSAEAVTAAVGYRVDHKAVREVWVKIRPEILGGGDAKG